MELRERADEDVDDVAEFDDADLEDAEDADIDTAGAPAAGIRSVPSPAAASLSATPDERHTAERQTIADGLAAARAAVAAAAARRPGTPTQEERPVDTDDRPNAPRAASEVPAREVTLTAKRLEDLGDTSRESADLLTADRLLDPHRVAKPEPEGPWSRLLYTLSGRRINIGDGKRVKARKELTARIAAPLTGTARFVPVLSRKGGVGKTTVTALLGMALADARDDRVVAIDANPDRGTLAERVVGTHHGSSVRDVVRIQDDIRGFHDISAIVARDETRLDVIASDTDPHVSEAFGDADYRDVAAVAAQYYSLVITDSGTGIVHSVMGAMLDLADQLVIVSGLSVDEARLASETLTWLETNGRTELARQAIVVLNQSTPGSPLVRLNELETHFATRAKHVVRIPYDPQIAGGGAIDFQSLQPETRRAARELAARLVEGLREAAR
nr:MULTISPECIES: MinD/ParA family protein [Microbacterium]